MNQKVVCLLSVFMLVAATVFSAGGDEGGSAATVATGEPQYGGTLTAIISGAHHSSDPISPDRMASGSSQHHFWRQPFQEQPLMGDFETYGPRGNNTFEYLTRGFIPLTYMKGQLLESFEVQADKIIWKVREGVFWHGNKPHVMAAREVVASDLVWWVNHRRQAPAGSYIKQAIGDAKEVDRYTLEIPFARGYDFVVMYLIGYEDRTSVGPPESVAAGADQWENQVGTGPFMNTEYQVGSFFRYERNPDYWDTTVIDGQEYQLPFIDELVYPIIPDEGSRIAALRTGKLDWHAQVPAPHWPTLDRNSDIVSKKAVAAIAQVVAPQYNKKPFDDLNVRRALMIGTDIAAFNATLGVDMDLPIHFHPAYPGDPATYTPIDELPAELAELYDYNAEKAKRMLADAGYPNGFRMELVVDSPPEAQNRGALLAAQWARLGVDVEVKVADRTTYFDYRYDKSYDDALMTPVETPGPVFTLQRTAYTDATLNPGNYSSAEMDRKIDEIVATVDIDEINRLTKQALIDLLADVHVIPLQVGLDGYYWWPWIQNYAGEFNVADANQPVPLIARMWLDQNMKAEMGF